MGPSRTKLCIAYAALFAAFVVLCSGSVVKRHERVKHDEDGEAAHPRPTPSSTGNPKETEITDHSSNCTATNDTSCEDARNGVGAVGTIYRKFTENKEMLTRTFYVLIGVTAIIVVYFVIRAVRIKRRQDRTKRYGVISTRDDRMEMTPLDQEDDDDEDMTVFEANGRLIK